MPFVLRHRRAAAIAWFGAAVVMSGTPARALDKPDSPAEAAFREGRELMAAGDLKRACARLAESQRLEPAAGTLLNLAECLEKRGLTASAWAIYSQAEAASAQRGRQDWQKLAQQKSESLSALAPRVTYVVAAEDVAAGAKVTVDGATVTANHPVPTDPGSHEIVASVPGRETFSKRFEARNGDKLRIAVELVRRAEAAPPDPAEKKTPVTSGVGDGSSSGLRTLGLVVGGLGAAGIVVGSVGGVLAIRAHDEAVSKCASYPDRCPSDGSGTRANESAQRWATISTVSFVAGGALLAAGAVLFLLAPDGKRALTVTPSASATGGGLSLFGEL